MLITDSALKAKRNYKKVASVRIAAKLLAYVEANHPKNEAMIKRLRRQLNCSIRLEVYTNGVVKSHFCGQKTCPICNSIREAKFLDKNLDGIMKENYRYHLVLTVRNPGARELKKIIKKMYTFSRNSSLRKNKEFRKLNNKMKFIRSFEVKFNVWEDTYHTHFHILLAGEDKNEIERYGNLIIEYWIKYFGEKANRQGQ